MSLETINHEEKIVENFFKIWITKEILHEDFFENYYITFLDKEDNFDYQIFEKIIENIYKFITLNDATSIRPNNSNLLDENTIKNIIIELWENYDVNYKFFKDLMYYIEAWIIEMNKDYNLSYDKILTVKNWIKKYLFSFYNNWVYSIKTNETIDDIVEKTIKILKKEK